MEKTQILHKKATKMYPLLSEQDTKAFLEKKEIEQQGQAKARLRLEELKNKFVNLLMRSGEKSKAYKLFAESLNILQEKEYKKEKQKNGDKTESTKTYSVINNEKSGQYALPELFQLYTEKSEQEKQLQKPSSQPILSKPLLSKDKTKVIPSFVSLAEQESYNDFLKNNILYQAVENIKPILQVRKVRKGGTTYQVPAIVNKKRQERLAIKWIIEGAEKRKKKNKNPFSDCLVFEILEAFNKTGSSRQRRDEQLKIAEYNRAYTRYRWW